GGAAADAYALGLAAVGLLLRASGLASCSAAPLLATYAFATTAVWRISTRRDPASGPGWFRPAQGLLIAAAAGGGSAHRVGSGARRVGVSESRDERGTVRRGTGVGVAVAVVCLAGERGW